MLEHTGPCVCFILSPWCSGRWHEGTISGLRGIFRKTEWPGTYEKLLVLFLSLTSGSAECSHLSQWAVFAFPRSGGSFEVLCMTSTDSFSVLGVGGSPPDVSLPPQKGLNKSGSPQSSSSTLTHYTQLRKRGKK